MEDRKYIVVDYRGRDCSQWITVHDTPEEANEEARRQWEQLSRHDQQSRHIYAATVARDDLPEYAIDEDTGAIDWALADDHDTFPGAWDSDHI